MKFIKIYCNKCKNLLINNVYKEDRFIFNVNKDINLNKGFKCNNCNKKLGIYVIKNKKLNLKLEQNLVNLCFENKLKMEYLLNENKLNKKYKILNKLNNEIIDFNDYCDYIIYILNNLLNELFNSNEILLKLLNKICNQ